MLLLVGLVTLLPLGDVVVGAAAPTIPPLFYFGLPVGKCSMLKDIINNTKVFHPQNKPANGTWYPKRYLTAYSQVKNLFQTCPKFTYNWNGHTWDFHATFNKNRAPVKILGILFSDSIYSLHMELEPHLDSGTKTLIGQIKNTDSGKSFEVRLLTFIETNEYRIRGICSDNDAALDSVKFVFIETAQQHYDIQEKMNSITNITGIRSEHWSSISQNNCLPEDKIFEANWILEPKSCIKCVKDFCKNVYSKAEATIVGFIVGGILAEALLDRSHHCCYC